MHGLRAGDDVVIILPESPTTGFRWAIDSLDRQLLRPQDDEFLVSPDSGVGGGGERKLTFVAQQSGGTHIILKLCRDWIGDSSTIRRFDVQIRIAA